MCELLSAHVSSSHRLIPEREGVSLERSEERRTWNACGVGWSELVFWGHGWRWGEVLVSPLRGLEKSCSEEVKNKNRTREKAL